MSFPRIQGKTALINNRRKAHFLGKVLIVMFYSLIQTSTRLQNVLQMQRDDMQACSGSMLQNHSQEKWIKSGDAGNMYQNHRTANSGIIVLKRMNVSKMRLPVERTWCLENSK